MRALLGLIIVLLLPGCATTHEDGFSQFYRGVMQPGAVAQARGANPPPAAPSVVRTQGDGHQVNDDYRRKGYDLIGYSSFTSGNGQSLADAQKQGVSVGADLVVVIDPKYQETRTASVPITTPTRQTYVTNGSATAYGSGGPVTAYGNSTTTAYGSQTSYVPMSADRYQFEALYFVRHAHFVLGAFFRDLNDAERQALQSNRGACIVTVVDGSPAFNADILVGDIVVAVNQVPVPGYQGLMDTLHQDAGQEVVITVFRNGRAVNKPVHLNEL